MEGKEEPSLLMDSLLPDAVIPYAKFRISRLVNSVLRIWAKVNGDLKRTTGPVRPAVPKVGFHTVPL
jgi:hypothetical protein